MEGFTNDNKLPSTASKDTTSSKDKVNQNSKQTLSPTIDSTKITKPKKIPAVAKEGFDIIGTENTIKRGKQSNSIPVNDTMRMSPDVLPHDGYSFSAFSSMV